MKLKLQTKITIIYALIFTTILMAINGAVFLTVKFYTTNSNNIEIRKTKDIVQDIIFNKGSISIDDLEHNGVRFPLAVIVKSGESRFTSIPGLKIGKDENNNEIISYNSLNKDEKHLAQVNSFEYIGPGSKSYLITIAKSIDEGVFSRKLMIITTAIASLLGMILSLAVGSYMSHETLKPINNMRKSVESLSEENLHSRILVPKTGDELTELGNTFNSLLDRLDNAYLRQSKFVSDASHELRTPLTVIKGFTDMLARWGKEDKEILDEAITSIKEETENMSSLVENLLMIAKGENNKLSVNYEKFNIYDVIKEVTEETSMNTHDKKIVCSGEDILINADRKMIKQLLRIFIENSIKFTPIDGIIKTSNTKKEDKVIIKVWDNGDGIAPKDITRIFERFFVADKARTKDKSGSGLGLSIAKWIVDVHRGKLSVESKLGQYTEFIVEIPINTREKLPPLLNKINFEENNKTTSEVTLNNEEFMDDLNLNYNYKLDSIENISENENTRASKKDTNKEVDISILQNNDINDLDEIIENPTKDKIHGEDEGIL